MEYMYEILITILIIFFVSTFVLSRLYIRKEKMKERLILIEKGIDISNSAKESSRINFPWLKVGIVLTSSTFGLILGAFIYKSHWTHITADISIWMFFLFSGIGMIIAHYVDKPKEQKS